MNSDVMKYALRFVGIVLLQVLILNNIGFLGFINPYLYVYFLLILPSSVGKDATLLIGFLLGITVDIFCGTLGCHAFASTVVAYLKPYLQKLFGPREDYEAIIPSIRTFGMTPFMQYAFFLVIVHHFVFFLLEAFTFVTFFKTLLNVVCCSSFTILLIYIIERLKVRR